MNRPMPPIAPPNAQDLRVKKNDDVIKQVRRYKLITPLFGGGVEPGVNDDVTLISGKAIRGHLRFWWRATRGGQFDGDLRKMKEAEDVIWGAASTKGHSRPSQVQIAIEVLTDEKGESGSPLTLPRAYDYVTFPLDDKPSKKVRDDIGFLLTIKFRQDQRMDVEAALWAWETFGGIGARTRRGFGSLKLVELKENDKSLPVARPKTVNDVRKWIDEKLKDFQVQGKWHDEVPHLATKPSTVWLKITEAKSQKKQPKNRFRSDQEKENPPSPADVWKYLIGKLKDFRQARFDKQAFLEGRGKVRNDHGISRWPEANEIRCRLDTPAKIVDDSTPSKFPRASFGLPINFHLAHDEDEPNVILQSQNSQRRASPLILKLLTCLDEKTVGLALLIEPVSLPPGDLKLEGVPEKRTTVTRDSTELTLAEAMQIEPLHNQRDVLQAFLSTIR
jgi:CRISPR-associated protein Cmr1